MFLGKINDFLESYIMAYSIGGMREPLLRSLQNRSCGGKFRLDVDEIVSRRYKTSQLFCALSSLLCEVPNTDPLAGSKLAL
jgi:hypothetical protein